MDLHYPAAHGVLPAEEPQQETLVAVALRLGERFAAQRLFERSGRLALCGAHGRHRVEAVVAHAAALFVKEGKARFQRLQQIGKRVDLPTRGIGKLLHIGRERGLFNVDRLIRTPGRQHAYGEGCILADGAVIAQIVGGIVRGADNLDVRLHDELSHAERRQLFLA